jgi:uncharacterized lipoprotein YbaY
MRNLILLPLSVALALTACGGDKPASSAAPANAPAAAPAGPAPNTPVTGPKVSGSISVDGVSTLPGGIELAIKLQDVTDPAALPTLVNERVTAAPRMLPSGFEIGYDPASIDQSRRYVIDVALKADGMILYGTPAPIAVLTQGAGTSDFAVTLVQGGKPVSTVAPPEQLKLDFQKLEAKLGALRRITGERLDDQVSIGWDAFVDTVSGQVLMAREQVELAEGGTTAYRFAYQGGQPWVIERKQGGGITLLGWTSDGQMILNEKGAEQASDAEIDQLKSRALALYNTAAARR